MAYIPDPNDTTQPQSNVDSSTAAAEFRALKTKIAQLIAGLFTTTATNTNPYGLVNLIHPNIADKGRSILASGWDFCGRNQQWGGSPSFYGGFVDAATGVAFDFCSFDGYIEDNSSQHTFGAGAGGYYQYQSITPPKNLSLNEFWLKLAKVGNPVDNVTVQLWSIAAGLPNALIATANVINGKQITSDTNGQWYRFTFAAVQALIAGTQYMIVVSKSAGVDAVNNYVWKGVVGPTKLPNNFAGFGTVVPAWTPANTTAKAFLCVSQASDQVLQSGGQFDWLLQGYDANPVNRGGALCQDLKSLKWNSKKGTVLIRGANFTKGKPFFDALYGLHHDRLVAYADSVTGVGKVAIFDKTGVVTTVVGTTDLSTATYKDVSIEYRTYGDGGDYLRIRVGVGGVAPTVEGSAVAQTFSMDALWGILGTAWIMGGFDPLFTSASYTKLSDMGVLPSADGWTFATTTATVEGNVFAVSGGKLNQISAGMAAGGDGNYTKAAAGFNNANGWLIGEKSRVAKSTNTKDIFVAGMQIQDGTKSIDIDKQEYYLEGRLAGIVSYPQIDLKSSENTVFTVGKGSDFLTFVNGRLVIDGTSQMTSASGVNALTWGDASVAANENADVIYDYVSYYNTAWKPPLFSSCSISEFAYWQEDASSIMAALYNLGVPISVKTYAGIKENYVTPLKFQDFIISGITSNPTSVNAAFPPTDQLPEMEVFCVGSILDVSKARCNLANNTDATLVFLTTIIDAISGGGTDRDAISGATSLANGQLTLDSELAKISTYFGLHKIRMAFGANATTTTAVGVRRHMHVRSYP